MIKKNFLTKSLAYLMSVVTIMTMFVMLGSITGTDKASALTWSYDDKGTADNEDDVVFFKSDVSEAANGKIIINSLGYFITIYGGDKEEKGTVFLTDTTNGSSYYPASGGGVSIPVKDIKDKINAEYAGSETRGNMLDALSSTFYMVLDTLLTVSKKGTPDSCAYTLKSTDVGYRDVVTAYTHLLNDPSASASTVTWSDLAIQRNRGSESKYTSACFCLAASSGVFGTQARINEIGFEPSFSRSLYFINWDGTNGNGHKGHADDGSNFIQSGAFGFSANTKTSAPSGYFAIPAGKGDGQPIVNNTDLQATNITFTQGDSVDSPAVSEPFREYESYRPVYTFYNNGSACIANFSCTNYATQHTITNNGVSVGANSTYKILGDRFTMTTDLYNTYVNDVATEKKTDYDFNSMWLLFSERCDTVNVPDLNGDNNIYTVRPKFAVATPNSVIGASTYEEYGANYSGYGSSQKENLLTGLTDVEERQVERPEDGGTYSISNGTIKVNSTGKFDCCIYTPCRVYLEEGKVYRFSCNTNGTWTDSGAHDVGKMDVYLCPATYPQAYTAKYYYSLTEDFGYSVMHKLDDGSYIFAARTTGAYGMFFAINNISGDVYFSDIRIEEYGTTTYLGQFGGTAIDNGIAYDRIDNGGGIWAEPKLYITNKNSNMEGYITYFGNPAANRISPVYLIAGQKYVVNLESNGKVRTRDSDFAQGNEIAETEFFMFWEASGPFAGSATQGGTINNVASAVESAYPNGVFAKQIGDNTFEFTPKITGTYYWRFDVNTWSGTYWFKAPEIYNVTEQEQLNITGGNLYTGFKDATLPTRTYYERIIGETVIKNKTATVTNTLTSILQVSPSSRAQEAYFYDTTGDVNLVAGQKYIFQCETNGTWAISGDELKESVPAQELIHNGDNVQVYLIPMDDNGNAILDFSSNNKAMITIGEQKGNSWTCMTKVAENTYMFTARKTGKYRLRLDVNKMGKTYWFKNPQIYNVTAYESYNLFVPLYDYEEETTQGKLVIKNNKVTITAKADDGCMSLPGYMRLEEGQEYYFSCDTDGNFENGEVEMYLFPSDGNWANANSKLITTFDDGRGVGATWEVMKKAGKNKFTFTCRKSGEYFVRLDVNKNGLTRWFSNLKITKVNNKKDIDITSIKLNTASKKLYSGQQVRFHSETQSLSMFNAKYTTELSATGINSAEITPQTINNMLKTIFNPFSGSFTPSFAKWATTLTKDSRPKYTNKSGLGAINVSAVSYENTIIGKYAGRDNEFKNTATRKYDVYPTDLEAVSVKVYDAETGKKITTAKDGQKVKVEYVYKNNTQLPVFATVFYTGNANKTFSSPTVNVETGVTEINADDYTPLLGDANGDGKITTVDLNRISQVLNTEAAAGDVKDINLDGKINETDLNFLMQYINGKEEYINEYNILKNRFDSYCWHKEDVILNMGETYTITKEYVISGKEFSTFKPEGRIYIKDLDFDTSYEYEGENNISNTVVNIKSPFSGNVVNINSKYRKSKTVVTSVEVTNNSLYDMGTPFYTEIYGDINATMKVYDNEACKGTPIASVTCDEVICAPADGVDTTLVWFKWKVPTKCSDKLYAKIVLDSDHNYSSDEYVDNGSNSKNIGATFNIETPKVYNTPDTTFAKKSPYWFDDAINKGISAPSSYISFYEGTEELNKSLSWQYYIPDEAAGIKKISETATLQGSAVKLIPDGNDSAYVNYDYNWTMKSGYGFKVQTEFKDNGEHCTGVQSGFAVFPEFVNMMATANKKDSKNKTVNFYTNTSMLRSGFENVSDKKPTSGGNYATFATFEMSGENNLRLPNNESSKSATHFVPIWFPQTEYRITSYVADAWTPGGMLSGKILSSPIVIEGNMYDDYVIEKK